MIETITGQYIDNELLRNYFSALINQFFKILPIREQESDSLNVYIKSLQSELIGCRELIVAIHHDPAFLTLVSILQYLIDTPDCSVKEVKREVFRAISICSKLKDRYDKECDEAE